MWQVCGQFASKVNFSRAYLPINCHAQWWSRFQHSYTDTSFFADMWSDPEKKNSLQEKVCNSASAFMQYACMAIPQKSLCNKTAPPVLFMGITSHLKKKCLAHLNELLGLEKGPTGWNDTFCQVLQPIGREGRSKILGLYVVVILSGGMEPAAYSSKSL